MRRRNFVLGSAAVAFGVHAPGWAQTRRRTPGQILGPYYPVSKPTDADIDLTVVAGRPNRARGDIITVSGRVLNEAGEAVPHAQIEVWQADSRGHYHHSSDKTEGSADPDFQGYAAFSAAADGSFEFMTIKPAPYPDDGAGGTRAPHIHFQVTGKINRLVTQMYFEGEPLNATDRVLASVQMSRAGLTASFAETSPVSGGRSVKWDIVLREG